MDTQELKKARDAVAEMEKTMLADIQERAALLGMMVVEASQEAMPATLKLRRKRRTRAEIAADNAEAGNG